MNDSIGYWTTDLNENAHYVVFNSYHECLFVGILPLIALCYLNFKIYRKIRCSSKMKHRYGKKLDCVKTGVQILAKFTKYF